MLDAIDGIDKASATPPVIVVFGDHGSWVGAMPGDPRLRFLPLLAARVQGTSHPLPDDEALVNVFPDLLDPLLGATFPDRPRAQLHVRTERGVRGSTSCDSVPRRCDLSPLTARSPA